MPAQHQRRRAGLKGTPRTQLPIPGVGGYDYPRGPFGATGYPGSAAAAKTTHRQGPDGRKDPSYQGAPTVTATGIRSQWQQMIGPDGQLIQGPATLDRTRRAENRMTPVIGNGARKPIRNQVAQRYKADPSIVRPYKPAPNPSKLGAHLDGQSFYHPTTTVYGQPDGTPITDHPAEVTVQSRYVSPEGSQEGYAVNRPLQFSKGGVGAYPPGFTGNRHLRGGRLTGQRYFGLVIDQQQIGLESDSYGIARRRGPRHRPVRFEQPAPWTANYYDMAPEADEPADMIHRSPSMGRRSGKPRRG